VEKADLIGLFLFQEVELLAVTDFLLLGAGLGAAYYLLRPQKPKETSQELLDITDVTEDGIIELPGFKFRSVIEVVPINMALRSFEEQAAIWVGFRNMLNSLTVASTFLIQTQYMNIRDYVDNIKSCSKGLPSEFTPYADELSNWLSSKIEGKSLRNRKYYVILKTDASGISEESIRIDSEIVDTIAKSVSGAGKAKMPPEEIRKQAYDQLQEARNLIVGGFTGMGIVAHPLFKKETLEMLYQTFNRDSASFFPQSFDEPPVLYPKSFVNPFDFF
jgi:hypothetical protein